MLKDSTFPSLALGSGDDADALARTLQQARALLDAAAAGMPGAGLRGRKLALWCADASAAETAEALLFRRAATALGAHVALVQPGLTDDSTPEQVRATARLLGRLYDAVECQGLAPALVQRFREIAGVPVYDGAATDRHATAALLSQLDGAAPAADKRAALLQALLVHSLGRSG